MAVHRTILLGLVLAQAVLWQSCEKEPTAALPIVPLSEYLFPDVAQITFRYDSVTYNPAIGGTAKRLASGRFVLAQEAENRPLIPGLGRYRVLVLDTQDQVRSTFVWTWDLRRNENELTHRADGIEYLGLTSAQMLGTTWNALIYTDSELEISIEGEPLRIHKDWAASVDSIGKYELGNGQLVDAVWVSHANSENRIELRRVREIYGRGLGLLERHVQILDSQNLSDVPWDQKAERGFTLSLFREP